MGVPYFTQYPEYTVTVGVSVDSADSSGACEECFFSFEEDTIVVNTEYECLVSCSKEPSVSTVSYNPLTFSVEASETLTVTMVLSSEKISSENDQQFVVACTIEIDEEYNQYELAQVIPVA